MFLFFYVVASNIPVVKEVEVIMDPAAFTVVRFATSAIPFIPFVWQARGDVRTRNAGIELGFWVSLGYLMQALGLLTSDAGRASFISMFTVSFLAEPLLCSEKNVMREFLKLQFWHNFWVNSFQVIVVPLLDGMLGAEVPSLTWFGAVVSIVGVAMLESSGSPPCVGVVSLFSLFFAILLYTSHE